MEHHGKVVAVLAANPALSSVLTAVLAASPLLRVRQFDSAVALHAYMRLAPVDLLIADFDCPGAPADRLGTALRTDAALAGQVFQIIALAGDVTPLTRDAALAAGIEEVIVKPMSPKYLLERVLSRLRRPAPADGSPGYDGLERRARRPPVAGPAGSPVPRGGNVVQLFGDR